MKQNCSYKITYLSSQPNTDYSPVPKTKHMDQPQATPKMVVPIVSSNDVMQNVVRSPHQVLDRGRLVVCCIGAKSI